MSYCPKCGRQILDESLGCPICNVKENTSTPKADAAKEAEVIKEFTVEDQNGTSQRFQAESEATSRDDYQASAPKPVPEQTVPTILKVIIIIAIVVAGGVGQVAGIIAGVVLLKSPIEDYRRFGKTLLTISCIMLGVWFLCCVIGSVFGIVGNAMYYYTPF
ncbi:MAG: hypothetical protein EOM28_01550 [Clostridia bacterium]|nr:hypothetical protein [Clostridia bacterium]